MKTTKENNENSSTQSEKTHSKTWVFKITYTNAAVFSTIFFVIQTLLSIGVSCFVTPNWVKEMKQDVEKLVDSENSNALLLLGSGTVYEYLKDKKLTEKDNIKYLPLPTFNAIKALREEHYPPFGDNSRIHLPINPIFMAASLPADSIFMCAEEESHFKENIGRIVSLYLGTSKLQVYISPEDCIPSYIDNSGNITLHELKSLLADSKKLGFKVFRTSENSSTKNLFEKELQCKIPEKETFFFEKEAPQRDFFKHSDDKIIVLCNEYYYPKVFDENTNKKVKKYSVIKDDDKPLQYITMPLYLYFMGYYKNVEKNNIVVAEDVKMFIENINKDLNLKDINVDSQDLVIKIH